MERPCLYLDIDGVLLTNRYPAPPPGIGSVLEVALTHFDCYWLTTHCQGDAATALRYLARHYEAVWVKRLAAVRPTTWDALKTDGIDFSRRFWWLDDAPFEAEKTVLGHHQCLGQLVTVNLRRPLETDRLRLLLERLSV